MTMSAVSDGVTPDLVIMTRDRSQRHSAVLQAWIKRLSFRLAFIQKLSSVVLVQFLLWIRLVPILTALDASLICNRIPGLVPKQRIICRGHPDAMAAIGEGISLALTECRFQFRDNRWNCYTSTDLSDDIPDIAQPDPLLNIAHFGSKESAFAYAVRSAGITHAITMACSKGEMSSCGCDRSKLKANASRVGSTMEGYGWVWGGCSADIQFGLRLGRIYVDAREMDEESQTLVNLHNNRVGRKAVREGVGLECKCHGVSGSCTARTCWRTLPSFRQIGDTLALFYGRAKQVEPTGGMGEKSAARPIQLKLRRSTSTHHRRSVLERHLLPQKRELVYLTKSPDYCEPDYQHGSLGTHGRRCNRTNSGPDGCQQLCCGRGFDAYIQWRSDKCNCKFHWCCYVTCEECSMSVETSICR